MTQTSISPRTWIEIGVLALLWGASFLSVRVVLDEVPVLTLVAHRVFWAALILWGWVAIRRLPLPRDPRVWRALLVMGFVNNAIPFSLLAWGQQHIETGLTSIFNAAAAVFGVLVAAAVFADERLTPRRAAGVAVAFTGVAVAIGLDALRGFDLRSLAQIAVLGAAFSYALAAAWARHRLSGLRPEIAAAGMLTGACLVLLPLALAVDGPPAMPDRAETVGAIAYLSAMSTAVAYLLYYRVLAQAGSGNALLVTLLVPPVAIVLGAVVLGERLAPWAIGGFFLIACGLAILDGRVLRGLTGRPAGKNG